MNRNPILLKPVAKDYLWGGCRLNDDFNLGIDINTFAEAWVCSTHPDGESRNNNGERLSSIIHNHPEFLGSHVMGITGGKPILPIIIKLIDANKDLSIQVHPNDEYAERVEGTYGKIEMWYVLDAKPNSKLVYGFNRDVSSEQIVAAINDGTVVNLLNYVPVKQNDVFMVNPGTVHAIGKGCLMAEIQEASNITYRLYDYDRIGKDGVKRALHIKKAVDVLECKETPVPRQPMRILRYRKGCAIELLGRCRYFQVERMILNTEIQRNLVDYKTECNSFHVFLIIDGCGSMRSLDTNENQKCSFMLNFFKGDCIFIPAESVPLKLHGKAQILDVSC